MKKIIYSLLTLLVIHISALAQQDTITSPGLLNGLLLLEEPGAPLLPSKILPTQALLWGEKGLMRNFNRFELTPENRQNELKLRRNMLGAHQILGFATLAGMVAQGVVGSKLYEGDYDLLRTHGNLATAVNISYFTTAGLSLFAPPKMLDERKGLSSIKVHRALAYIHLSGMIATNILANSIHKNPDLKPVHRAAAFTAFGAYAASMIVITF